MQAVRSLDVEAHGATALGIISRSMHVWHRANNQRFRMHIVHSCANI